MDKKIEARKRAILEDKSDDPDSEPLTIREELTPESAEKKSKKFKKSRKSRKKDD